MICSEKTILLYLAWPEECFHLDEKTLNFVRAKIPDARVVATYSEEDFLKELPLATHVVTWEFKAEWFERAPRLKLLATPSAGRELVPQNPPEGREIKIHFGGYHGDVIAESVAGFILAWARGFFRKERLEHWNRVGMGSLCTRVSGTKAVIIGYGKIGRAIGDKLVALGVKVEGFTHRNLADLPKALESADWFISALPGTEENKGIIGKAWLNCLPRHAVFVNIGRGTVVDEAALLACLKENRLAGAYLDVFCGEPSKFKKGEGLILSQKECDLPETLIRMPHSCASYPEYLQDAIKELIHEGLI